MNPSDVRGQYERPAGRSFTTEVSVLCFGFQTGPLWTMCGAAGQYQVNIAKADCAERDGLDRPTRDFLLHLHVGMRNFIMHM